MNKLNRLLQLSGLEEGMINKDSIPTGRNYGDKKTFKLPKKPKTLESLVAELEHYIKSLGDKDEITSGDVFYDLKQIIKEYKGK